MDNELSKAPDTALLYKRWPGNNRYLTQLLIAIGIFILSGLGSSYLYYYFQEMGGVFFPGLIYTTSTILIFLLTGKKFRSKRILVYYVLMNVTYLVMWGLTMLSSWFAILGGIFTAGAGAVLTFILVDKFVVNIKFSKTHLFIVGGLAFVITDICYYMFSNMYDKTPLAYILDVDNSPMTLFGEVFLFWQSLVGPRLFLVLQKT